MQSRSRTTPFKVLVMNQYLNPAGFLAVGPGTGETPIKTYGGLASAATAAQALAQPVYTRANISRLIVNLPRTAFNTFNWWGPPDGVGPRRCDSDQDRVREQRVADRGSG